MTLNLKNAQFFKLYPWVVQLKAFGHEFEHAAALIEVLHKKIFGKKDYTLTQKLTDISPLLDPQKTQRLQSIWLRKNWLSWYRVFIPKANFADTLGIELAMANIYYLRFAGTDKAAKPEAHAKHLADILGHVVKHRRFSFRKMRFEWCSYDTAQATATGRRILQQVSKGKKYWLLNYFEDTNRQFIEYYKSVFESDSEGRSLYPNGEGWIALLEDIARDQVHGEFKQVSNTEVHTLFLYLKHQKIKAEEELRKQKTT